MVSQFLHRHVFTPLLLVFFLLPAANSDLAADRAALLLLSSAVRGRTLRWNPSEQTPCLWYGVRCDNVTGRVTELRLPGGGLFGQIPLNSVGNLTRLRTLSLRRNSLSGSLPSDLSSCAELQKLFLLENQFSGKIPSTLFDLNNLVRLNLAGNNFSGDISPEFNNLTKLRVLYLENNNLTGSVPDLSNLLQLGKFNVSHNKLTGSIPSSLNEFPSNSFVGNSLCGSPLDDCPGDGDKLSAAAIVGIVIGSVTVLILIAIVTFVSWRKFSSKETPQKVEMSPSPVKLPDFDSQSPQPMLISNNIGSSYGNSGPVTMTATVKTEAVNIVQSVGNDGLVFFGEGNAGFSLEQLLRASAEVLGKGTFGMTFRTYMEGENEVVVKRLKNVCVPEREFREKVEGWGVLVHENLVHLKAYYHGREEKLLVYDSMPRGSLSTLLHGNSGSGRAAMTWEIRSKVAVEAARGIEYLHSLGPNFSHGNIRSSNILFTDFYSASVSDYGINQIVSSTSTLNLNGYCAPEVTDSRKVSQKADVYSFGVLLLELLTGKAPTNALWNEDGVDLPRWVQSVVQKNWTIDVFDPELLRLYVHKKDQMVQLLHLEIYCTSLPPNERPSMMGVTQRIDEICRSRR